MTLVDLVARIRGRVTAPARASAPVTPAAIDPERVARMARALAGSGPLREGHEVVRTDGRTSFYPQRSRHGSFADPVTSAHEGGFFDASQH